MSEPRIDLQRLAVSIGGPTATGTSSPDHVSRGSGQGARLDACAGRFAADNSQMAGAMTDRSAAAGPRRDDERWGRRPRATNHIRSTGT